MPPAAYVSVHPSARLSADERSQLIAGLAALTPAAPNRSKDHDDD